MSENPWDAGGAKVNPSNKVTEKLKQLLEDNTRFDPPTPEFGEEAPPEPDLKLVDAAMRMIEVVEGLKFDGEKDRWELLPWDAIEQVVKVLTFGARKYAPDNWRKVADAHNRYFSATMRHLVAYVAGQEKDPETGLPHLAHALCCVIFMLALDLEKERTDHATNIVSADT